MMDKRNLITGYYLIEQDLKDILFFVEPTRSNLLTYSHRLYALLVRACMEFEANCKSILHENNYTFGKKTPNINTYFNIHTYPKFHSVDDSLVRLLTSEVIDLIPLKNWIKDEGPSWYKEYNLPIDLFQLTGSVQFNLA